MKHSNPRRAFLKTAGAGLGATMLAGLAPIRHSYGHALRALDLPAYTADTFDALRKEYLLAPDVKYLNNASIGTIPRPVHEARLGYLAACETDPWYYMWSGVWEEPREQVRQKAATLMGCDADEVAITHNTTELFNVLAHGLPLGPGDEVLFSTMNHEGASMPFEHMAQQRGYSVRQFDFPVADVPSLTAVEIVDRHARAIRPETKVLALPHIDNMVGLRLPIRELTTMAHDRGVDFVAVDGAQAVGMIPVDLHAMGVDVYATSPHKWVQAPKGLGLAYVSKATQEVLRPMWVTWGQERWAGTPRVYEDYGTRNLPEVIALGDAIDFQMAIDPQQRDDRLRALWELTRQLTEETPGAVWRSPQSWELGASLIGVEFEGQQSNALAQRLFQEHGYVYRAFHDDILNTARLSPNIITTDDEMADLFALAVKG